MVKNDGRRVRGQGRSVPLSLDGILLLANKRTILGRSINGDGVKDGKHLGRKPGGGRTVFSHVSKDLFDGFVFVVLVHVYRKEVKVDERDYGVVDGRDKQ